MKKVVSIIVALFVFIGVNAQKVVLDATTFGTFSNGTGKGLPNAEFVKGDVTLSFAVPGFDSNRTNKGVKWTGSYLALQGTSKTTGEVTIECKMSSSAVASGLYIKKVRFNLAGTSIGGTPTIGSAGLEVVGLASDAQDSEGELFADVHDYYFEVEDGFSSISDITITANLSAVLNIQSVEVVYGYFEENVVISDGSYDYVGKNVYVKNVSYSRPMNGKNWGTLCLPFAYTPKGQNFSVYRIEEGSFDKTSDPITLMQVNPNEEVEAGMPVIFFCKSENLVVKAKDVLLTTEVFDSDGVNTFDGETRSHLEFDFCGVIKEKVISDGYYIKNNGFTYLTGSGTCRIKPFRAYIVPNATSGSARPRSLAFRVIEDESELFDNETTAVESVETEEAEPTILGIFTADGKKVDELQKGLNIVKTTNGTKKIYVR
jgi:hypothetical protein